MSDEFSLLEHREAELKMIYELHGGMQQQLEAQLLSLGWEYRCGQGLLAGIDWMADEIRRLRAEREQVGSRN